MKWLPGDRVKVVPEHYGSQMANRLGTVLRTSGSGLVEVKMDFFQLAGIGIIAFKADDLMPTKKRAAVRAE